MNTTASVQSFLPARTRHPIAIVLLLIGACVLTQGALAEPVGKARAIPPKAHPASITPLHARSNAPASVRKLQPTSSHARPTPKMLDRSKARPLTGPGPVEHATSSGRYLPGASTRALNPQPIPPGHAKPVLPPRAASVGKTKGH